MLKASPNFLQSLPFQSNTAPKHSKDHAAVFRHVVELGEAFFEPFTTLALSSSWRLCHMCLERIPKSMHPQNCTDRTWLKKNSQFFLVFLLAGSDHRYVNNQYVKHHVRACNIVYVTVNALVLVYYTPHVHLKRSRNISIYLHTTHMNLHAYVWINQLQYVSLSVARL